MSGEAREMTILERFPDARPTRLEIGSDERVHMMDAFGSAWCGADDVGVEFEGETIDDDPVSALCADCYSIADEEDHDS